MIITIIIRTYASVKRRAMKDDASDERHAGGLWPSEECRVMNGTNNNNRGRDPPEVYRLIIVIVVGKRVDTRNAFIYIIRKEKCFSIPRAYCYYLYSYHLTALRHYIL